MIFKRLITIAAIGLILVLVLLVNVPVEAQPVPANRFFGQVTINGAPAPDGTRVQARIGGNVCGETTTFTDGLGPGSYGPLDVRSDGEQAGCGVDGSTIEFFVEVTGFGFVRANETATWKQGDAESFDLTVTARARPVGGYGEPLSMVELLAPWLLMALLTLVAGVVWYRAAV